MISALQKLNVILGTVPVGAREEAIGQLDMETMMTISTLIEVVG